MKRKMQNRTLVCLSMSLVAVGVAGCDSGIFSFLTGFLSPSSTSVRFVNNTDFNIEGRVIIDDEQNTTEELIEEIGTEISFSVASGETNSISRDCDALQAFLLDDANLQVVGSAGPDVRSDVLRDGSDFNCGDTIVLTFTASAIGTNFDVVVTVVSN